MPLGDTPDFGTVKINPAWKITIVRSLWHGHLTDALMTSAVKELVKLGVPKENIKTLSVPGTFELPLFTKLAFEKGADGVIAFGIVVQGDTHHARLIAEQAASGLMQLQLQYQKPAVFEVLFVNTIDDARVRSMGEHGKGPFAARTLVSCLAKKEEII